MTAEQAVTLHKRLCKSGKLSTTVHEPTGKILHIECLHCKIPLYCWENEMNKFLAENNYFYHDTDSAEGVIVQNQFDGGAT